VRAVPILPAPLQRYGTSVAELVRLNPSIRNPSLIYPGEGSSLATRPCHDAPVRRPANSATSPLRPLATGAAPAYALLPPRRQRSCLLSCPCFCNCDRRPRDHPALLRCVPAAAREHDERASHARLSAWAAKFRAPPD
jgi:hypothetical protein